MACDRSCFDKYSPNFEISNCQACTGRDDYTPKKKKKGARK